MWSGWQGLLIVLGGLVPLATPMYPIFNDMLACPTLQPQPDVEFDKVAGMWHLTVLAVDATAEQFADSEVCVSGQITRHNATSATQTWTVHGSDSPEPVAMVELPTASIRPGLWAVQTPLGAFSVVTLPCDCLGELKATVFEAVPDSHLLISNCGWHQGVLLHLWTAALTRARIVPLELRRKLVMALEDHGFSPLHSRLISWHGC